MKRRKGKSNVVAAVLAAAFVGVSVSVFIGRGTGEKNAGRQGIPDVVSSRTENDVSYLTVVANEEYIEDREAFTETVLRMYEENGFYSTKFSRDRIQVNELYMSVYLKKEDVGEERPVFRIRAVLEQGKWNLKASVHRE